MSRPVTDADGNPVLCREAVAARDVLIEKLASLPPVQAALDRIVHHFGHDAVSEITARSRRVLCIADAAGERLALRCRPASTACRRSTARCTRPPEEPMFHATGWLSAAETMTV